MFSSPVLLAIPDEWEHVPSYEEFISKTLHTEGYDVIVAPSYESALKVVQSQKLLAVVMISDWAMEQDDGSPGLIEYLKDKVPTYSLITETTAHKVGYAWVDKLSKGRKHEYQGMPADIDAIVVWLNQTVQKS